MLDSRLVYRYKEKISVPHLSYIDDLLGISKCGIEALNSNIFLTLHIEMKRMNFNVGGPNKKSKCHRMHVGPKHNECYKLSASNRIMQEVTELSYLGDVVSNDSKNYKNIKNRISRSFE